MTHPSLFLFAAVYLAAIATPGPGIAALVARVLANGLKGVVPFILGYVIGDWIWLVFAASGLQVIAKNFAPLFMVVKYAGAAYLMFMAIQMWRKHTEGAQVIGERDRRSGWQLFLSSLTLTIGNPKVIVFFVSILPLVVDLKAMTLASFAEIFVVCAICLIAVLSGYVLAANGARALFQSARAMRNINRGAASIMAGAAVVIAAR
jgi:threonine/homoserine/homoserine lactone efflux protein